MVGEIRYRHAVMIGVPPVCVEACTMWGGIGHDEDGKIIRS